jgi:repressor of nif and glnA expression
VYCPKCGTAAVESALYCHSCGARLPRVTREEFSFSSDELVEKVKQLIHEGNVSRIIVKGEKGETLVDIPVTAGVVGIVLAPILAAVGVVAAIATKCTVVVERREMS